MREDQLRYGVAKHNFTNAKMLKYKLLIFSLIRFKILLSLKSQLLMKSIKNKKLRMTKKRERNLKKKNNVNYIQFS